MIKSVKITFLVIIVAIIFFAVSGLFLAKNPWWLFDLNNKRVIRKAEEQALLENCRRANIPITELDTTLDPVRKIVVVRWWNGATQQNEEILLPYKPETEFEGCSESAKRVLKHVQQASIE